MAAQRSDRATADGLKASAPSKRSVEPLHNKCFRLMRQLAALAAATVVVLATEVFDPPSVDAVPPPKPKPAPKPHPKPKPPPPKPKPAPKPHPKPKPVPKPPPKPKPPPPQAHPKHPAPAAKKANAKPIVKVKPHPKTKQARREVVQAFYQVHAAKGLPIRKKDAILRNIHAAMDVLGEALPQPQRIQPGNHIKLAEEHLHKAHKELVGTKELPPILRKDALAEIKRAIDELKAAAQPGRKKAASPRRSSAFEIAEAAFLVGWSSQAVRTAREGRPTTGMLRHPRKCAKG